MTTTDANTDATSARGDSLVANGIALVLGTAAFSVSFTHVMRVASEHGQGGWVAKAIATSVELMALASVAEIRRRKSRGEPVWVAVGVLLLGVAMSLASNLATAAPGAWGKTMAAWPAVAFLAVATLVESRTSAPAADAQSPRTNGAPRTGQAADARMEAAQSAALGPYDMRTLAPRPQDATRTDTRTQDAQAEPIREPRTRTEPVRTEPARTEQPRTQEAAADQAPGSGTDQVPTAVDQAATAPAPTTAPAATQDADEPRDAAPVQDAPAPTAVPVPAAPVTVPALTMPTSTDTPDSSSDSALATASDSSASLAPAAPANGWLPGSSGLLLPATYAAGAERRELIVPGRPAPVPGPRPVAPASARTDQTRPRTAVRAQDRTERGAKPRTDSATHTDQTRTDSPRTDRPARTDVVAELVAEIRTDARWRPDYEALAARTGYKRSFLEKCVGDARRQAVAAA